MGGAPLYRVRVNRIVVHETDDLIEAFREARRYAERGQTVRVLAGKIILGVFGPGFGIMAKVRDAQRQNTMILKDKMKQESDA
jgi:hypothetical protein